MTIEVNGQNFDFFEDIEVTLLYNSIASTFRLTALYDASNDQLIELLRPLQYRRVVIKEQGKVVLTGTMLAHEFTSEAKPTTAVITGYSLPGVLQDCEIPTSSYPLQFSNISIADITAKLIQPFGLGLVIDDSVNSQANEPIAQIVAEESEPIAQFISRACAQKNLILTHNEFGQVLITRNGANQEVSTFFDEQTPATKINLKANGRRLHGPVIIQKQQSLIGNNSVETSLNNNLVSMFRPKVKTQDSGQEADTTEAARNEIANQLRGINITITTDRLFWLNGQTLEVMVPNRVVQVRSENAYINGIQRWFVEKTVLKENSIEQVGLVSLVLPEVYNGQDPRNPF